MCVLKHIVSHTITRFYTIFFINDPQSKKYDKKVIQKNFDNKTDADILLKEKSSRFIIGIPRYLNFCEPKK